MKNKTTLKHIIKLILPPLVVKLAKVIYARGWRRTKPEWEYVPQGWQAAKVDANIKGWNVQAILDTYIAKWPDFVASLQGTNPLGLSPEAEPDLKNDIRFHNIMMTYAYALGLAAHQRAQISMLDWGGGIGHYYLISKALLPDVQVDYHCKDLPIFAAHGQQLFPEAHFYADDQCLNRHYDFVLASSSLQYAQDWASVL